MALSIGPNQRQEQEHSHDNSTDTESTKINTPTHHRFSPVGPPLVQLHLLPNTPVQRSNHHHAFPWTSSADNNNNNGNLPIFVFHFSPLLTQKLFFSLSFLESHRLLYLLSVS